MSKIKVVIIDDHDLFLEGVASLLNRPETNFTVIHTFTNPLAFFKSLPEIQGTLDIILLDLNMPHHDGFYVLEEALKKFPNLKFIVISSHVKPVFIRKIIKLGAMGYVRKDASLITIEAAIKKVFNGSVYYGVNVLLESDSQQHFTGSTINKQLSAREIEVIQGIAEGLSSLEISQKLHLSKHTIDSHRKSILLKINGSNTIDVVRHALKTGLVKWFELN